MKIPNWAPHELVSIYDAMVLQEKEFNRADFSQVDLDGFAQKHLFAGWAEHEIYLRERKLCLERLLTDENARIFWVWFESVFPNAEQHYVLLWSQVHLALVSWYRAPRMTEAELQQDYARISELAQELSAKLKLHAGAIQFPQRFAALVSPDEKARMQDIFHPDLIERLKNRGYSPVMVIDYILPPLFTLLDRLALNVRETVPRAISRKAKSRSALLILMLDALSRSIGSQVKFSAAHWASFLAAALNDDSITDATVRMAARRREWWSFANDCGEIS